MAMFMVAVPLLEDDTGGAPRAEITLEEDTGSMAWAGVDWGAGAAAAVLTLLRTLHAHWGVKML